jgi:hypothetical protein
VDGIWLFLFSIAADSGFSLERPEILFNSDFCFFGSSLLTGESLVKIESLVGVEAGKSFLESFFALLTFASVEFLGKSIEDSSNDESKS